MIEWAESLDSSVWTKYIKPTLDYIVRIAELIALAALFKVAADQVDSLFLDAMAYLLILVIGAYAGIPLGIMHHRLRGITVKSFKVAVAITLPIGLIVAAGAYFVGHEASEAVKALSEVTARE